LTSVEMKICRTAGFTLFDHKKEWRNSGRAESRTSWRETEKIQSKLAMTCNKNEQQDAEL